MIMVTKLDITLDIELLLFFVALVVILAVVYVLRSWLLFRILCTCLWGETRSFSNFNHLACPIFCDVLFPGVTRYTV